MTIEYRRLGQECFRAGLRFTRTPDGVFTLYAARSRGIKTPLLRDANIWEALTFAKRRPRWGPVRLTAEERQRRADRAHYDAWRASLVHPADRRMWAARERRKRGAPSVGTEQGRSR